MAVLDFVWDSELYIQICKENLKLKYVGYRLEVISYTGVAAAFWGWEAGSLKREVFCFGFLSLFLMLAVNFETK